MAIARPCYCNRADVQRAPDFKNGLIDNGRVDRALQSAAQKIEGQLHRLFYPNDTTYRWDWPNYQFAYPWRVWLGKWDLQIMTQLQSPFGTVIPLNQVIGYPLNRKISHPFRQFQLDRSTTAAFGAGPTPQASIWATGTWGWIDMDAAGTIAVAVSSSSQNTVTVSDGSQAGPGDVIILNPGVGAVPFPQPQYAHTLGALAPLTGERCIVTDVTAASTGLTQSGGGCTTASEGDNQLTTTGSGALNPGEVLILDAERMLVTQVIGSVATVIRAWDGTVLATHSAATVNALRQFSVLRGQLGTTAASSYSPGTAVSRHRPPQLIRDLSIAEAENQVMQEISGYARTVGGPDVALPAPGTALADMWDEAVTTYGRKARQGAV